MAILDLADRMTWFQVSAVEGNPSRYETGLTIILIEVYLSCFGIEKTEIEDEKFVSRLKRSGLGG